MIKIDMSNDPPVIAIDGPSASGKGTVAERVAAALGFRFLDSGALYRLAALAALRAKTPLDDAAALARVASGLDFEFSGGRPPSGRRCSPASGDSGPRRASSPTAATWARSCSRTPA